jgi:hypothetical protein
LLFKLATCTLSAFFNSMRCRCLSLAVNSTGASVIWGSGDGAAAAGAASTMVTSPSFALLFFLLFLVLTFFLVKPTFMLLCWQALLWCWPKCCCSR